MSAASHDFRVIERFARRFGVRRVGRFIGGPVQWHHRNPDRIVLVKGRRLP
jgi:hypothetical protein